MTKRASRTDKSKLLKQNLKSHMNKFGKQAPLENRIISHIRINLDVFISRSPTDSAPGTRSHRDTHRK
jgi:hypothetical protein